MPRHLPRLSCVHEETGIPLRRDMLARLGGDEFAVVAPVLSDAEVPAPCFHRRVRFPAGESSP
jgi:GGDEF domain-containing protein